MAATRLVSAVTVTGMPNLSPDGLRLVLGSTTQQSKVMYSDRPSVDMRFRQAVPLMDIPDVPDPFLTEDCARVYFSGIGSVFYAQRL